MDRVDEFTDALVAGEKLIGENPNRFIFMPEKPRFANNNLGWIKVGEAAGKIGEREYFGFLGWKYKPAKELCDRMFSSGEYFWNPGYFITSTDFLLECYQKLAPEIYAAVVEGKYEESPKVSFDAAIIEKVYLNNAVLLKTDMGWSDPGTLYALKEALQESAGANVTKGNVYNYETDDSLVYNTEDGKLLATVGLKGMVVVNTKDAIVVVHKDNVIKITELLKKMKEKGLDKYL
jgi:mannose-1-phosphate guanylyltransferase